MTRAQARTRIREIIEDQGSFYSDADLNNAIQECYTKYVIETKAIEKKITLSFTTDLVYYNFKNLISDFLSVNAIYDITRRRWLDGRDRLWLDGIREDWELMTGSPKWFSVISPELVAIVPHDVVASGSFDVYYDAIAPTISNDVTNLLVLREDEKVFDPYSNFYLMLQAKEFSKAKISYVEFEKLVKEAKAANNARGLPTREYRLQG